MSTTLVVFIALIAVVFTISVCLKASSSSEYAPSFAISPARLSFFNRTFNLTEADFRQLRFDGRQFHVSSSASVPYEKFSGVKIIGTALQTVSNSSLPHTRRWLYQRVDGGADRRFNGNKMIMTSKGITVELQGERCCSFTIFCHPNSSQSPEGVQRLNEMFAGAQHGDFEEDFEKFQLAFDERSAATKAIEELKKKIADCSKVLEAQRSLNTAELPADLQEKCAAAEERYALLNKEVLDLEKQINKATSQEANIIFNVQKRCRDAHNHRTIASFT